MLELEADYVIIGAGSAGCVLANRLSARPDVSVLLLEAGGDDRPLHEPKHLQSNLRLRMPGGFGRALSDPSVNWLYTTQPDARGRVHTWPRGRVLGGSSAINGLLWVVGAASDYDGWAAAGARGWDWAAVAPAFAAVERAIAPVSCEAPHPMSRAGLAAFAALGLGPLADPARSDQPGAGLFRCTIRRGRRVSAADAFLNPARRRPNLRILTHALVHRIGFAGRRAEQVEFDQGGVPGRARARREVIVAAGAVASPALLERSGVGQVARLRALGVEPVADLPGVGENLQDHYITGLQLRLRRGTPSLNSRARGLPLLAELLRWLASGRGLLASGACELVAYAHAPGQAPGETPAIQFHCVAASMDMDALGQRQAWRLESRPGLTIGPCQLRPFSRGSVHAAAPDPRVPPAIVPNYLADPRDVAVLAHGLRLARRWAATPPLADHVERAIRPPDSVGDEALAAYCREVGSTLYHPVGTCRMGADTDPLAVVDPQLRVRGLSALRVVDASVMPAIPSGNTNAPTMMVAERAAAMILADAAGGRQA
jgi:choline dehydrogenase